VFLALLCYRGEAAVRELKVGYYAETCPEAEDIVRETMARARAREARSVASVMRLQFHDCFVNVSPPTHASDLAPVALLRGFPSSAADLTRWMVFPSRWRGRLQGCDGSVLMDATPTMPGEKDALSNINSLRSFEVVDEIKEALEERCPGVVSCADIVIMAARDAVVLVRASPRTLQRSIALFTSPDICDADAHAVSLNLLLRPAVCRAKPSVSLPLCLPFPVQIRVSFVCRLHSRIQRAVRCLAFPVQNSALIVFPQHSVSGSTANKRQEKKYQLGPRLDAEKISNR
jgi:hypothetical protein